MFDFSFGFGGSGGNRLQSGYIFRTGTDGVIIVGLSVSDYDSVDPAFLDIFFNVDGETVSLVDAAIATQRAFDSPLLNAGGALIGVVDEWLVLYPKNTSTDKLSKAYAMASQVYSDPFSGKRVQYLFSEGTGQTILNDSAPGQFDAYFGESPSTTTRDPSWVSGGINTQGGEKFIQAAGDSITLTLTACSVYFVGKKTGASVTNGSYDPAFSNKRDQFPGDVAICSVPAPYAKFSTAVVSDFMASIVSGAVKTAVLTYDGAVLSMYVDGIRYKTVNVTGLSVTITELFLSIGNNYAFWPGDIYYFSLCDVAHSQPSVLLNLSSISNILKSREIDTLRAYALMVEGDSITADENGYPHIGYNSDLYLNFNGHNAAIAGSSFVHLNIRASAVDDFYYGRPQRNILSILMGANDLSLLGVVGFISALESYITARKAASPGLLVVVGTILPKNDSTYNALRAVANPLILASTVIDAD